MICMALAPVPTTATCNRAAVQENHTHEDSVVSDQHAEPSQAVSIFFRYTSFITMSLVNKKINILSLYFIHYNEFSQ